MKYPIILITNNEIKANPIIDCNPSLTGEKERILYNELKKHFNKEVKRLNKVKLKHIEYKPDILYWDKENKIAIDIEIDEPYHRANDPIHCMDEGKDNYRNNLFLENGWSVIRFSEYQIVKHFDTCIKLIKEIIESIQNRLIFNITEAKYPDSFFDKRWTFDDAKEMARNSIRDRYGYIIKKRISENKALSKIKVENLEELTNLINDFLSFEINLAKIDRYAEQVLYIMDISDILINESKNSEYIFIKIEKSNLHHTSGRQIQPNKDCFDYYLEKKTNISLFNKIIETKISGKLIKLTSNSRRYFNLFLIYKEKEESENLENVTELISMVNRSIFIDQYFSLTSNYF